MFPPVHPFVAYLCYAGWRRLRGATGASDAEPRSRAAPSAAATLAVVCGAVVPDLVDQPLARLADVPSTRTLGHSLLFVVPLAAAVAVALRRRGREDAAAGFAVGALSHPLADALWPALLGLPDELGFLLWPLAPSPDYEGRKELLALGDATVTTLWVELALAAAALALWWRHGRPGAGAARRLVGRASDE